MMKKTANQELALYAGILEKTADMSLPVHKPGVRRCEEAGLT